MSPVHASQIRFSGREMKTLYFGKIYKRTRKWNQTKQTKFELMLVSHAFQLSAMSLFSLWLLVFNFADYWFRQTCLLLVHTWLSDTEYVG